MKIQFVIDSNGEKLAVILPIKDYQKLLEALKELQDIKAYNEAKKNDTGERIPMEEAFKMIEAKRKINT